MHQPKHSQGFTLPEVIVSCGIFAIVALISVYAYCGALRDAKGCCAQINYTASGRIAQQRITQYVENGRCVATDTNGVNIYAIGLTTYSRIAYLDVDRNGNKELVYYPDGTTSNNLLVLCRQVSPITTNAIFNIIPSSPCSVGFAFHIGDTTNATAAMAGSYSGMYYQGIDIRFSATPRNLLREYQ